MSPKLTLQRAGLSLATLLAAALSLDAAAAFGKLPRERTSGAASFVTGGVSDEDVEVFKSAFRQYPLVVELYEHAGTRDEYTADAHVKITDRHGETVLDGRAEGPFMLVRLPAGDYTVAASLKGKELPAHKVHVTEHGHASSTFVFPAGID
jgi:hypothetical protein